MKNEKQQNRNKRILIAIIMLLITGIALTTATYAWFSANTAVTATGIDVKVTTSAGIAISADAKNFGKTTTMDDIITFAKDATYDSTLQLPAEISPVTTMGAQSGMTKFNFYRGELGEDDEVLLTASSEVHEISGDNTSGDFIAFDLYFRSSTPQAIRLSSSNNISAAGDNMAYLQSAIRLGFLNLGTTNDTSAATSQGSAYNLAKASSDWKIWNPYPYVHHNSSLYQGYSLTEEITKQKAEAEYGYYAGNQSTAGLGSYEKDGSAKVGGDYEKFLYKDVNGTDAASLYTLMNSSNSHYIISKQTGTIDESILTVPTDVVFNLGAGVTKIRVYIWLEGNDIDCVDMISISDGLKIDLGFEIAPTADDGM